MKPVPTVLLLVLASGAIAAPGEPGRLFYTPAQRTQLEAARSRGARAPASAPQDRVTEPPRRYDGVLIRSDGEVVHWIDGKPATTAPGGLRPGQTRVDGRAFEPYQLLVPQPAPAHGDGP